MGGEPRHFARVFSSPVDPRSLEPGLTSFDNDFSLVLGTNTCCPGFPNSMLFRSTPAGRDRPQRALNQLPGVTLKSSKYIRLSAFDQRPMRPETGCGKVCSR